MRPNKRSRAVLEQAAVALGNAINDSVPTSIVIGQVESVNEEAKTIDAVVDDDRVFRDVSLDIFPDGGNSVLIFPPVGSLVVIGFIENFAESPVLLRMTAAETIIISNEVSENSQITIKNDLFEVKRGSTIFRIENNKLSSTSDLTEYNGGSNDGTVLINELTASLNGLVSQLTSAFSTFNSHTHPFVGVAPGVAAITSPTTTPMTPPSQFNKTDYENTKITQ